MLSLPLLALWPMLRWLATGRAAAGARRLVVGLLLIAGPGLLRAGSPPVTLQARLEYDRVAVPSTGATTAERLEPVHLAVTVKVGEVAVSEHSPLVVVLLLDVSGSMSGSKLEQARRAAACVIDQLTPEDRLSILTFEDTAHDLYSPVGPPDLERARQVVAGLQVMGGTNMVDGVRLAMRKLGEIEVPGAVKRVLLLGDGDANLGTGDMNRVAAWARDHDAAVSSFGVGTSYNTEVMAEIARVSGGNYYGIPDEANLVEVFASELREMGRRSGAQAQLVVKPSWGLELGGAVGDAARLEAGPGVISMRSLVAGSEQTVRLRLVRRGRTPPPGTPGRVDVCVSYLDQELGDGRQAWSHDEFTWAERFSTPRPGVRGGAVEAGEVVP